jgi:LuxR family maltose regulon positive regulatory protein
LAGDVDLLIHSKLRGPLLRPQLVARPRLVTRVHDGLRGPLTLIAAPAGFGKTTLAAGALDALAAGGGTAAWLSLDGADDEIGRFLAYLLAALQTASPALGRTAGELLAGPQLVDPQSLLVMLVNDLVQQGEAGGAPLVLVLDDYHLIHSAAVHAAMTFLIDHAPPSFHLLITTRADPPLPLARLRARGHLVEIRGADLRFTLEESAAFLNAAAGIGLADELVALLDQRTEGWAAGLQLAALRLAGEAGSGPGAVDAFVRRFSGTQRYVLDYLLEEVLGRQGAAAQRFLLLTSPLERLCGPLCDAVLQAADSGEADSGEADSGEADSGEADSGEADSGEADSGEADSGEAGGGEAGGGEAGGGEAGGGGPPSGAVLASLEAANVFLTALDDERRWYRYHSLFADLLRARLREQHPGVEGRLRAAAAGWLEANGFVAEAVAQALAAGEGEWAARLVEQHTVGMLARGELASLLGSISALPPALRDRRAGLCLQQAYALAFAGQLQAAGAALDLAGKADGEALHAGAILAVRSMLAAMAAREGEAVDLAQRALALLTPQAHWDRAAACWALGYARRSLGDLEGAQECFAEQIRLARLMGNVWTLVTGLTDLALVLRTQGELQRAGDLLGEALDAAHSQGARSRGYIARMETGLAAILYERNELGAALQLLDNAVAHLRLWPNPNHIAYAYLLLARVKRAQGDAAATRAALRTAWRACREGPVTRVLQRSVEAESVRVRLCHSADGGPWLDDELAGEAERLAAQWRAEIGPAARAGSSAAPWDEVTEMSVLALCRAALDGPALDAPAADLPSLLPSLLRRAAADAGQAQRLGAQIEALVLLAIVQPQQEQRFGLLEQALALAGPRGFVRLLVDVGEQAQGLLRQWLALVGAHPWRAYALRLLAATGQETAVQQPAPPAPPAPPSPAPPPATGCAPLSLLAEPLSGRELEVLGLLAQGLSNRQIAEWLVVAPGTIKAHTAAIYRKLDVANRTEAAACARRLGLLQP